jgi:hypothetical protein
MSNPLKPKAMNTAKEYLFWLIYAVMMLFIVAAVVILG